MGKLSVDRDLANDLEPINTFRLFNAISVRKNTLDMYAELNPRIPNAVRKNLAGVTFLKIEIYLIYLKKNFLFHFKKK